ncbi:MAG: hypothetical protein LBU16_07270 [Treponema sp.]|jgi:hypothetical protein|nr:hypothetical protein [Treponema sp.]
MEPSQTTALPPEYEGITFEKVWATLQENAKRHEEIDRLLKEQSEEADRRIKETERLLKEQAWETDRLIRENQKLMSDLGRKFGTITEHMFIPNLEKKFNALGYEFGQASSNVRIGNKEHNIYAEIDVFLQNGECALAVEVKTQANIGDIREHIGRMKRLRRYFDLCQDQRKLYGAVAAAVMPDNVRDYALKQGFYVIKQSGDNVSVEEPHDKAKAW